MKLKIRLKREINYMVFITTKHIFNSLTKLHVQGSASSTNRLN